MAGNKARRVISLGDK